MLGYVPVYRPGVYAWVRTCACRPATYSPGVYARPGSEGARAGPVHICMLRRPSSSHPSRLHEERASCFVHMHAHMCTYVQITGDARSPLCHGTEGSLCLVPWALSWRVCWEDSSITVLRGFQMRLSQNMFVRLRMALLVHGGGC